MEKATRTNRHCRVCGCVPCINGTLCEGDMYPMDHEICLGMAQAFPSYRLIRKVREIVDHPRYQGAPRSPKPRFRKR